MRIHPWLRAQGLPVAQVLHHEESSRLLKLPLTVYSELPGRPLHQIRFTLSKLEVSEIFRQAGSYLRILHQAELEGCPFVNSPGTGFSLQDRFESVLNRIANAEVPKELKNALLKRLDISDRDAPLPPYAVGGEVAIRDHAAHCSCTYCKVLGDLVERHVRPPTV